MRSPPSSGTHTVAMSQLTQLDQVLSGRTRPMTAAEIGAEGNGTAEDATPLPGSAVLLDLCWEGPPAFPYVSGHFTLDAGANRVHVLLSAAELHEISHRLGMRHVWDL